MEETVKSPKTRTARNRGKDVEEDANVSETELITLSDSDREEGEVRDGSDEDLEAYVCKFFLKGGCAYGNHCRFFHMSPDKGLYRMLERSTVRQQPTIHILVPPPGFGYVQTVNFQPFQEADFGPVDEELETSWDRALKETEEHFNAWKAPRGERNRSVREQTTKATGNDVETSCSRPVGEKSVFTCELPPDVSKTSKSNQHFRSDSKKTKMTDLNLKSRPVKPSGHPSDHRQSRSRKRQSPSNARGSSKTTSSSSCRDFSPPKDSQNCSRLRNRSPPLDHKCRTGHKRRSAVRLPSSDSLSWTSGAGATLRKRRSTAEDTASWISKRNFNVDSIFWACGDRKPNQRKTCAFGDDCHFRHAPQYRETGFDREINLDEEEDVDALHYRALNEAEELLRLLTNPPDSENLFNDVEVPSQKTVKETKRSAFKSSDTKKSSWSSRRQFIEDRIRKNKSKTKKNVSVKGSNKFVEAKKFADKSYVCKAQSDRYCIADDNISKLKMTENLLSKPRPVKRCGRGQSRVTSIKERRSPSSPSRRQDRTTKSRNRSPSINKTEEKCRSPFRLPSSDTLSWTSDTSVTHRLRSAFRPSRSSRSPSSDSSYSSPSVSIVAFKNRRTSTPKRASTSRSYQKHDLKKSKTIRSAIRKRW